MACPVDSLRHQNSRSPAFSAMASGSGRAWSANFNRLICSRIRLAVQEGQHTSERLTLATSAHLWESRGLVGYPGGTSSSVPGYRSRVNAHFWSLPEGVCPTATRPFRTIGERPAHDLAAFQKPRRRPIPARRHQELQFASLVRFCGMIIRADGPGPKVFIRGCCMRSSLPARGDHARPPRSYEREDFMFNPLHYLPSASRRPRLDRLRRSHWRYLKSLRPCGDAVRRVVQFSADGGFTIG